MAKKRYYGMSQKGAGMIPSAQGAFANMYQGSFTRTIGSTAYMTTSDYPDTMKDVDLQLSKDIAGAKRQASKTKF